jgi:hypothetical protein
MTRKISAALVFIIGLVLGPVGGVFIGRWITPFFEAAWTPFAICGAIWSGTLWASHAINPPRHHVPEDIPDWRDRDWNAPDRPEGNEQK